MLDLEHGIVKFFDDRDGKKFGFLKVLDEDGRETGEEVFFHFNDGQFVDIVGGDCIEFIGRTAKNGLYLVHPQVGDKLAFDRASGKGNRDKACPWTYAAAYDHCVRMLTEPRYRVVRVTKLGFGGIGDSSEVIWEGQGADELTARYPIRVRNGMLDNPLAHSTNFDAGSTTRYLFEVWMDDDVADSPYDQPGVFVPGGWSECADPRYRSERAREMMGE
jgi:cold shock CspA family protein